jgi:hypothetical protein
MSHTEELLSEISGKIDKMLRLFAVEVVKGIAEEQGKIELLDSLGFRSSEIARLLNKTPDNVSVQLNKIRKKKEKSVKTVGSEKAEAEREGEKSIGSTKEEQPKGDDKK